MSSDSDTDDKSFPTAPLLGIFGDEQEGIKRRNVSSINNSQNNSQKITQKNFQDYVDFSRDKEYFSSKNETLGSKFKRKFGRMLNSDKVFKPSYKPLKRRNSFDQVKTMVDLPITPNELDDIELEHIQTEKKLQQQAEDVSGGDSRKNPLLLGGNAAQMMMNSILLSNRNWNFHAGTDAPGLTSILISIFGTMTIFVILIMVTTIISIFIPIFSVNVGKFITALTFLIVLGGWIIFKLFFVRVSVVNYVLLISLLGLYIFLIFIYIENLSFVSIVIIHSIIGVYNVGFILLVYFTRSQFSSIKTFSPGFDSITYTLVTLFVYIYFDYFSNHPALMFYIFLAAQISVMLQFANEITEIYKGVSGAYQDLNIVEGIMVLSNIVTLQYVILITILYVFKIHGFIIPALVPWGSFITSLIEISAASFSFL